MFDDNWAEKLGQALNESDAMVVLVTHEALTSINVRREKMPWILRPLNVIKLPGNNQQQEGIN